ncbi:MAG: energy transducer TonB [Bacteroidota bacterium]
MLNPLALSSAFMTMLLLLVAGHSQPNSLTEAGSSLFVSTSPTTNWSSTPANRPAKPLNIKEVKHSIGYPPKAKDAGIEGKVVLRILVNEEGEYVKHTIMESFHPLLRIPCELHAPLITFEPAIQNGEAVTAWVVVPFSFRSPNVGV